MYILDKHRVMQWLENLGYTHWKERYMVICECGKVFKASSEGQAHVLWSGHNRGENYHIVRAQNTDGITQIPGEAD